MNKIKIEQHSLWEFLKDVQEATLKGYVLDLDTNEYFPQSYGSYYSVTLVKDLGEVKIVAQDVPVIASLEQAQAVDPDFVEVKETEVETAIASIPVKRTRKPKAEAPVDATVPE